MKKFPLVLTAMFLLIDNTSTGWWSGGHAILTRAAVKASSDEMPAFFRSGGAMIAHCAYDPDISKNRDAPIVRSAEHSEHYIDLELLQGRPLPKNRYEFIQLCADLDIRPEEVGAGSLRRCRMDGTSPLSLSPNTASGKTTPLSKTNAWFTPVFLLTMPKICANLCI